MTFDWLVARPIAHRGWHAPGRPENTLAAAQAALDAGFAVECDVRRTSDGEAVLFHDATLDRLTSAAGAVGDHPFRFLRDLAVQESAERIPKLAELLALIAGRTPLICEIKSDFDGDMRLAQEASAIAAFYDGPLAFKSFDPDIVAHLRGSGSPRPLGIVAEADYDDPYFAALLPAQKRDYAAFLHIGRTHPDFLSWCVDDLPHPAPTLFRAFPKPVMAWTVRTPAQWTAARAYADQAVFEGPAP